MKKDLVSIVIPIYNSEKYLFECVQSIINQTYKDIEIFLINDGSTDKSDTICNQFLHDTRIKYIKKENEGLSKTRNQGFLSAVGEYICTIDSDDYVTNDYVEKLLNLIKKEDSDIAICGIVHESGDKLTNYSFGLKSLGPYSITSSDIENNFINLAENFNMSDSWGRIYKSSFIKKSNVIFTLDKNHIGTDLLYNYKLMLHLPIISVLNESLYVYRIINSSKTRSNKLNLNDGFKNIISGLKDEMVLLKFSDRIMNQLAFLNFNFLYVVLDRLFIKEKSLKVLRIEFKILINDNISFRKRNNIYKNGYKNLNTSKVQLKIFILLILNKMYFFVFYFFYIRRFLKSKLFIKKTNT